MMSAPVKSPSGWLRRADQAAAGALIGVAIVAMAVFWWWNRNVGSGLIDIDRTPRQALPFLVDVNEADWPEFMLLPEVGETLARRIVAYRKENGRFRDPNELRRVRGIGEKTLEEMKPYLAPMNSSEAMSAP